jgi:hypothetical protein
MLASMTWLRDANAQSIAHNFACPSHLVVEPLGLKCAKVVIS